MDENNCRDRRDCWDFKENPSRIIKTNIGSRDDTTYVYWTKKDDSQVICGCFKGDLQTFEEKVKQTYKDNEFGIAYQSLINAVKLLM